jgi:hypothetical protein
MVMLMYVLAVTISTRVSSIVLKCLDEAVEQDSEKGAEQWANPVDPVVAIESAENDIGTKGARRIK